MTSIAIKIFYNILYMSVISSFLAIIILLLRKAFDKKISPRWKFAMWTLLLISLIIPTRITIQSNNSHTYTISSIIDWLESIKNIIIISNYGRILTYIWISGIMILFLLILTSSINMRRKIGKKEIKEERIIKIFSQAKQQMNVKKEIKLVEQEYKKVPCIYGVFATKILLTRRNIRKR